MSMTFPLENSIRRKSYKCYSCRKIYKGKPQIIEQSGYVFGFCPECYKKAGAPLRGLCRLPCAPIGTVDQAINACAEIISLFENYQNKGKAAQIMILRSLCDILEIPKVKGYR